MDDELGLSETVYEGLPDDADFEVLAAEEEVELCRQLKAFNDNHTVYDVSFSDARYKYGDNYGTGSNHSFRALVIYRDEEVEEVDSYPPIETADLEDVSSYI